MSGLGSALGNGFSQLFKGWGKGISNAVDNYLVGGAEARKAITDEVINKFKPKIDLARAAENKRAANIAELDKKLTESKQKLADDKQAWQDNYDAALAGAKTKRQTDIADYDAKLKGYQDALADAKAGRQSILDQLYDSEAHYDLSRTVFTDVNTGKNYIFDPFNGGYRSLDSLNKKERKDFLKNYGNFDTRLFDSKSGNVINAFDKATRNTYKGTSSVYDNYLGRLKSSHNGDMRNASNQIKQAQDNLDTWKKNNNRPADWDDINDSNAFKNTYEKTNAKPNEYSFNGQTYKDATALDNAYQDALKHETALQNSASKIASKHILDQKAEIAKRIQDAKDIKKAKLALGALGAGAGAGALYAGAKAIYGGDDTPDTPDNTDNTNNIDNTDNTYTGEPNPDFNVEKEGQAILKDRQQIDTGFDPDKAEAKAVLAGAAYDKGVEDGNSIESSDDHFIDDDELYGLLKAMEDPHKADAVANYIYSKHGNESDVQNLGWRGWLNKYYGDLLRSKLGIDPSGYKGMHVSGGL